MQPWAPEDESQWNYGYIANVTPTFSLETTTEIQREEKETKCSGREEMEK